MAQIIKHRRGTLAELSGVTLNNGELGIVTGSVTIGDAPIKTAIVVGNTDGTNRLSIGRLAQGSGSATLVGKTGGANWNDMIYYDTNDYKLQTLHTTNGVTTLDLTGNIAGGTVGGTLTTTGNLSVQAHISSSANITGSAIYASSGFYGDGSNLTGVAQDIDSLDSYGAATIHQTQDEFLISDNGTEKRITFSNLQDSVFADITGDVLIAAGGAATIQANSVALGTDTTNTYISTITPSSGILLDGGSSATSTETATPTLSVDSGSMAAYFSSSAFSVISGDVAITAGGVATVTGATTNAALTAGVGLSTTSGTFNGGSAVTFALDLSELSDVQIASGDKLAVLDSDGANEQLESIDDIATLFAGDGLQASSAVMAVDVSDFAGTGLEDDSSENLRLAAQGTGISGGAGSTLSITPGQTAITSVYNTALKVGSAASQEYVDFSTTDEVNTKIDNTERLSVTATGADVTGVLTVSSNATIEGNLTVNGLTTFISSSTLDIGDNIIVLNSVSGSGQADAGIQVIDRVGTAHTGSLLWNATNDFWHSGISGSTHYRHPVQASTSDLTENKPVIVDGNGRLESSANITDDGTTVNMGVSTHVTGSVYVSAGASVAAASASLVSFRNNSTTQLGYLASADTQAVTTGLVGYNTSNGNLTISSVIDGGSF